MSDDKPASFLDFVPPTTAPTDTDVPQPGSPAEARMMASITAKAEQAIEDHREEVELADSITRALASNLHNLSAPARAAAEQAIGY